MHVLRIRSLLVSISFCSLYWCLPALGSAPAQLEYIVTGERQNLTDVLPVIESELLRAKVRGLLSANG